MWSRYKDQLKQHVILKERVGKLEAQVENTPSKESVHQLMLSLSDMGGTVKVMQERLGGFGDTVKRSERVMERVEKYLLEHNK
nr:DUF2730 family protein [Kordiimonas marina]